MKTNTFLFFLIVIGGMSCTPSYQVYNLASSQVKMIEEDVYLDERDHLAVTYDFWSEGGVVLFEVYNHQDSVLYLDLKESKFIVNGNSYAYFVESYPVDRRRKREQQEKIMQIAPHESQVIEGFPVNYDWQRLPKKQNQAIFGEADSPLKIENKLVYSFDEHLKSMEILRNEFWISEISQIKRGDFNNYSATTLHKSDKFYLSKDINSNNSYFWLDVFMTFLQIVVAF